MLVHTCVNSGTPDGRIFRQSLLHHLNALWGGNHTTQMDLLGFPSLKQRFDGCRQTASCRQHGIDNKQRLVLNTLRGNILRMNAHLGMLTVDLHTESRHKTVVSLIEDIKESLMER